MTYELYTDGSFKGRWGSWAYIVIQNNKVLKEVSARVRKTNSNRMEFQAAIEALKSLPANSKATVFTDSRILIENIPLFQEWSLNNWQKKNNRKIPNVDQFIVLNDLIKTRKVTWQWVKAHAGNMFNERCDELCKIQRSDQRSNAATAAGSIDLT